MLTSFNSVLINLLYPVLELHWTVLHAPNRDPPWNWLSNSKDNSPWVHLGSEPSVHERSFNWDINGISQLIGTVVLFLFSTNTIWVSKHVKAVTNCGFCYLLFICVAALVGLVLFSVVAKKYKYRERDNRPYGWSAIEEIFYRRIFWPRACR